MGQDLYDPNFVHSTLAPGHNTNPMDELIRDAELYAAGQGLGTVLFEWPRTSSHSAKRIAGSVVWALGLSFTLYIVVSVAVTMTQS